MITYTIEVWHPGQRCHIIMNSTRSAVRAFTMFNKPYYKRFTRRIVRTEISTLQRAKANK